MTAQVPEKLIYGEQELSMCSEQLNVWLCTAGRHLDLEANSSACWRGYIGTWKIINDRLYLVEFKGNSSNGMKLQLKDLFSLNPNKVFAHWYSGEIRCPYGKILDYVHMGFASTYEKDFYLKFSKGILISKRIITNGEGEKNSRQGYAIKAFTIFNKNLLRNE